ncbi:unnamed protein product [Closterium sp. NIES-54]
MQKYNLNAPNSAFQSRFAICIPTTSTGGTTGARGAGGATGAGGAGSRTGGAGPAIVGGVVRAGGATGAASSAGTGGTAGVGGDGAVGAGGTAGAGGAGGATRAAGSRGAGGTTGAGGAGAGGTGGTGGAGAASPRGACTRGVGATGVGCAAGAKGPGAAGASGAAGARGTGAAGDGGAGAAGIAPRRPFFYPQPQSSLPPPDSVLRQCHSLLSSIGLPLPFLCPPTDQSQPQLLPGAPLPALALHTEVTESLTERRTHGMALRPSSVPEHIVLPEPPASSLSHVPDSESDLARAASPTVTRLLATVVTFPDFESTAAFALVTELVDFATRSRLDYMASLVTEFESVCPPSVGGETALSSDVLEDRQFELECLAATLPHFASMLLCLEGDPDALGIPTPRSYTKAIAGEYSSKWHAAMDAEMASSKSTGTYVSEYISVQQQGVDFFYTFSPTPKMTTLQVLLHVAAQRDYELHSLDFSTAFL